MNASASRSSSRGGHARPHLPAQHVAASAPRAAPPRGSPRSPSGPSGTPCSSPPAPRATPIARRMRARTPRPPFPCPGTSRSLPRVAVVVRPAARSAPRYTSSRCRTVSSASSARCTSSAVRMVVAVTPVPRRRAHQVVRPLAHRALPPRRSAAAPARPRGAVERAAPRPAAARAPPASRPAPPPAAPCAGTRRARTRSRASGSARALAHEPDHHVVRHQPPRVHQPLGLAPERRPARDRLAQDLAGRDQRPAALGREPAALRSLAHARRPEQDEPHVYILCRPRMRPRFTKPS